MTVADEALRLATRFAIYVGSPSAVAALAQEITTADEALRVLVIEGATCKTEADFFKTAAAALSFPDYFGHNWDAFWECLDDLAWQPPNRVCIVLRNAESILMDATEDDARILVSQLADAFPPREEIPNSELHVILQVARSDAGRLRRAVEARGAPVTTMPSEQRCRVCGLEQAEAPWGEDGLTPSFAICDACGTEFGYEDATLTGVLKQRTRWLDGGGGWFNAEARPTGWSLEAQLRSIPAEFQSEGTGVGAAPRRAMNIHDLIHDYQAAAKEAVELLVNAYGHRDLVRASRDGRIPRYGEIGEVEFSFHGGGLRVAWPNREVDFDFGPEERFDGFDAWRLSLFAEQVPGSDVTFHDQHKVQCMLDELLTHGEVIRPRLEPSVHLYYLATATPPARR